MTNNNNIRAVTTADLSALAQVIEATGLFPSEMLEAMFAPSQTAGSSHYWLTCVLDDPVAVAYYAPEAMTDGTWNLYLIAVHPDHQGKGVGAALMKHVEDALSEAGQRVLLVETSGDDEFARTRGFYQRLGYDEEARIREFYAAGEDKIIFRKALR